MRSNELVGDAHKMSNMSGIIHESSIISSSDKGRVVTARPSTARIGTARPTTARAAPPKLITQQQLQQQLDENETIDTPSVRTIEAIAINTGTGSGPLVSIIRDQPTDGAGSDDDDGNDGDAGNDETNEDERGKRAEAIDNGDLKMEKIFKTNRTTLNKETMDDDVDFGMGGDTLPVSTSNVDSDAEKGALVRQLVQSKRMLESVGPSSDPSRGSASSERAKSAVQQLDSGQLKRVMDGVQRLCRLANPTSKAIEYLQEELDMMLAERRTWIAEAQSNRAALTRLQSNCVQELKSLQDELSTLERQVQQQQSLRTQRIGSLWQAHRSMMQAAQQLVEQ